MVRENIPINEAAEILAGYGNRDMNDWKRLGGYFGAYDGDEEIMGDWSPELEARIQEIKAARGYAPIVWDN